MSLGVCLPTHPSPSIIVLSNGGDMCVNLHQKILHCICNLYRSKRFFFLSVSVGVLDTNTVQIASPKTRCDKTPSLSYFITNIGNTDSTSIWAISNQFPN